jgi:two-component system response regulator MprA
MLGGKPVLIVEDDPDIRNAIKEILEMEGHTVVTACDGLEGLEALKAISHPCVILLDVMMPRLDGWGFMQALIEEHADTLTTMPVIIVSATLDAAKGAPVKPAKIIKKPVDIDALISVVARYCVCDTTKKAA